LVFLDAVYCSKLNLIAEARDPSPALIPMKPLAPNAWEHEEQRKRQATEQGRDQPYPPNETTWEEAS
jgi:hypothetical protein